MQYQCKMVEYKMPKFSVDVDVRNKEKKMRKVTFRNEVKISVSDKISPDGIVVLKTNVSDENGEIQYSFEIRGVFNFPNEITDKEDKEKILKKDGFQQLYEKTGDILGEIQKLIKQKLPDMPPAGDVIPMDEG